MITPLFGQSSTGIFSPVDSYCGVSSFGQNGQSEEESSNRVPINCVIGGLRISLNAVLSGSQTYTLTLRKNGVDTLLKVRLIAGQQSGSNNSVNVNFLQGDSISFKITTSSAGLSRTIYYNCLASATEILIFGTTATDSDGFRRGGGAWINIQGKLTRSSDNGTGTPQNSFYSEASTTMPIGGRFRNFYIEYDRPDTRTWTFNFYKNLSPTSITAGLPIGDTLTSDLINTATFVTGDTLAIRGATTGTGTLVLFAVKISFSFLPDNLNEFPNLSKNFDDPGASDFYHPVQGGVATLSPANAHLMLQPMRLYDPIFEVDTAPGPGQSITATLRINSITTSFALTISDTAISSTSADTITISCNDLVDWKVQDTAGAADVVNFRISTAAKWLGSASCPSPFRRGLFDFFEPSGGNTRELCN